MRRKEQKTDKQQLPPDKQITREARRFRHKQKTHTVCEEILNALNHPKRNTTNFCAFLLLLNSQIQFKT